MACWGWELLESTLVGYNEVFGLSKETKFEMNSIIDLNEIINKYELSFMGRKYVHHKKEGGDGKLDIIMSAHNQGEKYMALRTFIENSNSDLLFLNNPENSWYLDNNDTYSHILFEVLKDYKHEDVTFYGSSMSGYASIYYAIKFNANSIAINPQVNLDVSYDLAWDGLKQSLDKMDVEKLKLEKYCVDNWQDSVIYIVHGHDDIDLVNVELLSTARPKSKKLIIHTIDDDEHVNYLSRDYDLFNSIKNVIENMRKVNANIEVNNSQKRKRRIIRNEISAYDPYRDLSKVKHDGVSWFNRREHEKIGNIIHFYDVGLYDESMKLSGAICSYNGNQWVLISPILSEKSNILTDCDFIFEDCGENLLNNVEFYDKWWARVLDDTDVNYSVSSNELLVNVEKISNKNLYISKTPQKTPNIESCIKLGGYFTLFVDVAVNNGAAYVQLGGVSNTGYFHKNSEIANTKKFTTLSVFECFQDIDLNDSEYLFLRVVFGNDSLKKKIKVKNPRLYFGFLPMELK